MKKAKETKHIPYGGAFREMTFRLLDELRVQDEKLTEGQQKLNESFATFATNTSEEISRLNSEIRLLRFDLESSKTENNKKLDEIQKELDLALKNPLKQLNLRKSLNLQPSEQ